MAGTGKLDGRMALITGGSRGIGAAIGRAFAAEGADVAFCHNDDDVGAAEVATCAPAAGAPSPGDATSTIWRRRAGCSPTLRRRWGGSTFWSTTPE